MKQFYPEKNINKLLLLIIGLFNFSSICAQTYTESFNSDPTGGGSNSFTSTTGGVGFKFTFTPNENDGFFEHSFDYGNLNSASLFAYLNNPSGAVTIKRNDGQLFEFKSLYLNNNSMGGSTAITVQGYKSNLAEGTAQSVGMGSATKLNFNTVVDEIRISGGDIILDDFTWGVYTAPAAVVTNVTSSSANGVYKVGDLISVQIGFSEAVTVTGTPTLTLETGTTDRVVNYTSGSGTNVLTFSYTVQSGDLSADLDYVSVNSFALNGGTIEDAFSNDVVLSLPSPGAAGSLGANKALTVDGVRPTATLVVADTALRIGETSVVTITFSEAVSGFSNADLAVANGTLSAVSSSDGGITWTATFTPTASITDATNLMTLDNTGVSDAAGNTGSGTTDSNNYSIDTARPMATIVVADTALRIGETSVVTITFSEAVTGFTNADLAIANGTLSGLSSSDGGVSWTATFTPTASITDATNLIILANTGVSDAAGNTGSGTTASNNYSIDTARPTATLVVADTALRIGETSEMTITFSEAVSDFTNADLTIANGTLSTVSSSDGGVTWTATFTPTASITDATNLMTLDNTGVSDAAGNTGSGTTASNNYSIDTARPTATLVVADTALKIGETSVVTITFSEAVTGFTNADLAIDNGTLSAVSSSDGGVTWTATFTPTTSITDATNLIILANTGVSDAAGNTGSGTTASNNYSIDTMRPTATLVVADTALRIGETSVVTITFSEAVTGFSNADLAIANGIVSGLSSSDGGITWTATFTPTASITDATNLMTLDNTGVSDAAGNTGTGTTDSNNYSIDTARPTATIVVADTALRIGETSVVTITFSEAVTGFTNADLTIANGTLSTVSSSDGGITWTATFTPTANITDTTNLMTLDNTGVSDAAGNTGSGTTYSNNYSIDTARPTATLVVADTALGAGETSVVTITFSEAVTGFTNADLAIANGTLSGLSSSDGGVTWTATFTPTASITDATNLMTLDNTGVSDAAGNTGSGTTDSNNYSIDTIVPTIVNVSVPADASYISGHNLDFTVNFSEMVTASTVGGSPQLSIIVGSTTRQAMYFSGSGTSALLFRYTVQIGELDTDGIGVGTLVTNGGTIQDGGGNNATLTLNSIENTTAVLVDAVAPSAYSVTIDQDPITEANESAVSITFADAEIGTTFNYTFSSDAGGNLVTANGIINATNEQITGVSLNGLNSGVITVSVTLTDSAGNRGSVVTDTSYKLKSITGVTLGNDPFVYDETSKALAITGTLPTGTSVAYTNNSRTDVGTQEVTATVSGSNYNDLVLKADLTITPATITGITFLADSFVYDETSKALAIAGTLPTGTSVAYTNNSRTDVGTQEVTATVSGSNYNDLVLKADLTIAPATITGITFLADSFVYDETVKGLAITGTLPTGTSVAYTNNLRTDVGTQEVTATVSGSNYNDLVLKADLTITPATITGITFLADPFVYDETSKALVIAGTLPTGTSVAYTNNSRTDVGTQEVTATVSGSNYNDLVLKADLTIAPATITGVTLGNDPFVYDETVKGLAITGTLPTGTSVAYTNNSRTDVGTQEVTATVSGSNYNDLVLKADLTITPATITGITFLADSFVYDETVKGLAITGTLPTGTSVAYTNNSRTDVGTQEVTATVSGSNYNDLVLKADLTITPATIMGITFLADSFVYDETSKALAIAGTLPTGTSVAYTNNLRTDVGTQEVTATVSGSNYNDLVLKADLTITPATITGITFLADSFVYDETVKGLAITGTLPTGTSVAYTNNSRTDVGTQEVTATVSGSNYNDLVLKADLTITKKAVLVTANPEQTKIYGETDPVFTYNVNGENLSLFTGALSRATGENAGMYAISLGTLSAGANYSINFETSNFEITKADQQISWNQDLNFGCHSSDVVALLATATSGLPVVYSISDAIVATIIGNDLIKNNSGTAQITASQAGDQNHNPATTVINTVIFSQMNLIRQHWENVLFFDNSSENFVAWQWYKNGIAISGASKQYYNEDTALNGNYYAVGTTKSGQQITSCLLDLAGGNFTKKMKIFPNPVKQSAQFTIESSFEEASLSGATINIFNLAGTLIQTSLVTATSTQVPAPSQPGIYIVSLILANGDQITANLLVN